MIARASFPAATFLTKSLTGSSAHMLASAIYSLDKLISKDNDDEVVVLGRDLLWKVIVVHCQGYGYVARGWRAAGVTCGSQSCTPR